MKALIFDVDGTLADTEKDGHRVAFNRAFAEAGLDWAWSVDLYGDLLAITGGKERIQHYMDQYDPVFELSTPVDEFIANLHQAKTRHYKALVSKGGIALRPGVESLLRAAHADHVRLAIATTTTLINVTTLIGSTLGESAIDWFEVIGAGDVVERKKPAPDIYQWVLDKMELTGQEAIAFEDSENGVKSAAEAGVTQIIVTTNAYTAQQDFSAANIVMDGLGDANQQPSLQKGDAPLHGVDLAWLSTL